MLRCEKVIYSLATFAMAKECRFGPFMASPQPHAGLMYLYL